MRIGELAARAGVSVRALRYYEEQALLYSERSGSGQRQYAEAAVERVQLIQHFYSAGLASRTIKDLLPCLETGTATPSQLTLMLVERERIDEQIEALNRARTRLHSVIEAALPPATSVT
jgi:DNA-binding transcriptional MerR regulator